MPSKNYFLFFAILFFATSIQSQVGIGTTNPSPAAMLEVSSQTDGVGAYGGFMPPRVPDITARDLIDPEAGDIGLLVFVETIGCLQMWSGTDWLNVKCIPKDSILLGKQDFEVVPSIPVLPISSRMNGYFTSGSNPSPGRPQTSLFVSSTRGYGVKNSTAIIILGPVNVSSVSEAIFKLRLAAFSTTNGNGMEMEDTVIVSISTNGVGGPWSEELYIEGDGINTNHYWGFEASRVAMTAYTGSGMPNSFFAGTGNDPNTGGISYLEITDIPNSSNLAVKIEMKNNSANEIWVIDDAEIWGN